MTHQLVNAVAWLSLSRVLIEGYTFGATIYIANLLSPRDYALMGVAMIVIGLSNLLTEFGLGDAVIQRKHISESEMSSVFWFAVFTALLVSLCCVLLSQPAEAFFDKPGVSAIIKVLSVVLLLRSLSIVPYKLIEKKLRFKLKAKIDIAAKFLSVSLSALFAYWGYGVWSLVYAQIIYSASITILSFASEPFRPRILTCSRDISDMINFGLNVIGLRITWYVRGSIDKIIAGKFLDKIDFGFYSFAFKLTQHVQDITHNVLSIVSLPLLAKNQDDHEKFNTTYLLLLKFSVIFAFPIFIGGIILSKQIIHLFFADKWMPMIEVFRVACFVQIIRLINSINENLFIAIGKPHLSLMINLITLFLLGASFLWSVQWGMGGLLLTWMLIFPILFIGSACFTIHFRKITISSYFKSLYPALSGTAAMCLVIFLFKFLLLSNIELATRLEIAAKLSLVVLAATLTYIATVHFIDKTIVGLIFTLPQNQKSKRK